MGVGNYTFRLLTLRVLAAIMAISALGLVGTLYFGNHHNIAGVGWTRTNVFGGFFRVGYSFFAGVLLYRLFASRKSARYRDWHKVIPWVILGLVAMTLCAKPPVMIEPYYEFVVAVLLSPAIIYCALWFEPGCCREDLQVLWLDLLCCLYGSCTAVFAV